MGKSKKLFLNTITPLIVQVLSVISGLLLPALRLEAYGSEDCGLITSVAQFLGIISFLELGVGAVVKSSLYKPLAENDAEEISRIMKSAQRFFSCLGFILLAYVVVLCAIYPSIVQSNHAQGYIIVLIISSSISFFSQYFFGIVNRLLLNADQKIYVQYILQAIQVILNFAAWILLIKSGASIQIAVFVSGVIFLISPVYMYIYVRNNYKIDYNIEIIGEPIKQKWNGIAQHVAAIVRDSTDVVVLSVFASLKDVAIYSVYQMVVANINSLFFSAMNGVQSLLGEYWAKNEKERMKSFFSKVEWITHSLVVLVFGCTSSLLVPFILVYTRNITDANYDQKIFGTVLVFAFSLYALRFPYNIMILAAGHYQQTQNIFITAALVNVTLSILAVKHWGIVGVAIGTAISMIYETLAMVVYLSKNILCRPIIYFAKQLGIDCIEIVIGIFCTNKLVLAELNYNQWFVLAVKTFTVWSVVCLVTNIFFKKNEMKCLIENIKSRKWAKC